MFKAIKLSSVLIFILIIFVSCEIHQPIEKSDFNFTIHNTLGYEISHVYAGAYRSIDDTDILSETSTIKNNGENSELTPPMNSTFNIWYKYYEAATNTNWTVRLTDGNGVLSDFLVYENIQYYLELFINDATGEAQYRLSTLRSDGLPEVFQPEITFSSNIVTISTQTNGAAIFYTTNGLTPSLTNGSLYTSPFVISGTKTIKAIAVLSGYENSPVATEIFTGGDPDITRPIISAFVTDLQTGTTVADIITFTASDAGGIAGYLIKIDDDTTPAANDPEWTATAPATVILPDTFGTYNINAWVKDTSGNISLKSTQACLYELVIYSNYEIIIDTTGQPDFLTIDDDIETYTVGDINSDTLPDIIFAPSRSENIYVAYQAADHSFPTLELFPISKRDIETMAGPNHIEIGDLNNDNRNDVVICSSGDDSNTDDNYVGIYYQKEDTKLDVMFKIDTDTDSRVRIGDFNNDNRNDLIGMSAQGETIDIFLQNGIGELESPIQYSSQVDFYSEMLIGDISGDGNDDIIATDKQGLDPSIHIFISNGDGTLQTEKTINLDDFAFYSFFKNPQGFHLGNFDSDPESELVMSSGSGTSEAKIMIFDYSATDILENKSAEYYTYTPDQLYTSDVNEDGYTDIVYINNYTNELETLINKGDGTFTAAKTAEPISNAESPFLIDLDNDGYVDVLLNSSSEPGLTLFRGTSH